MLFEGVNDERTVTYLPVLAAGPGFEPRYHPPEGRGLPLADPAIYINFNILDLWEQLKCIDAKALPHGKGVEQTARQPI